MNPDTLKYLQDIQDSIERIEYHLRKIKTFSEYSNDYTVIDAVERRLAIIGEALSKATKLDTSINVTDQKKIIALCHILTHDYDLIDDPTIWKITQNRLTILKEEIKQYIP